MFQQKLIPNLDPECILGVRTPVLRKIAKTVDGGFRMQLPHQYFEENQIHAFSLENMDFDAAIAEVCRFLPYVDNWATCDQLRPKVFGKNRQRLLPYIRKWLHSDHPYTIRFGMEMLMVHYLEKDFDPCYLQWVNQVEHEDYYVRMMQAWFFATALAKQYVSTVGYIADYKMSPWVHNMTIRKATESFRISSEQKTYLKQFRIK